MGSVEDLSGCQIVGSSSSCAVGIDMVTTGLVKVKE